MGEPPMLLTLPMLPLFMALTMGAYLGPWAYEFLWFRRNPTYLSDACDLDLAHAARASLPMFAFHIASFALTAALMVAHVRRLTSQCDPALRSEWMGLGVCTIPLLFLWWDGFAESRGAHVGLLAALVNVALLARQCSLTASQAMPPSMAARPIVAVWAFFYMATALTNVALADPETSQLLSSTHRAFAGTAYLTAFPLVLCMRARSRDVAGVMALATACATLLVRRPASWNNALGRSLYLEFASEYVGQALLSIAFARAVEREAVAP